MSRHLLTHMPVQSLRLPLRSAHRGPLHPGHYGTGLPRPSMRSTTRAVFAPTALTSITPARLKGRATRPVTTHPPRVTSFAETARAPRARYARRSLRSEVAAAKLRPTVAVLGGAGVFDDATAAARQRQAARRRARLPFDARGLALRAPPQRRIMAHIMRPFTPSHGPRRRGPRLRGPVSYTHLTLPTKRIV